MPLLLMVLLLMVLLYGRFSCCGCYCLVCMHPLAAYAAV
jgi:hypothetical protein